MAGVALSVVIPTLEEAGNIRELLERLDEVLADVPYEALVVDGGSTDGTPSHARAADARTRVLEPEGGPGLAASVAVGIRAARGEHVCVMDGDGQHPAEAVLDLVRATRWRDADLVVGSRYVGGGADEGLEGPRRAISAATRVGIKTLVPSAREAGLSDPTSGLFLFRRDRVDADALDPSGYKILLEVLEAGRFEHVEEVGYVFQRREAGESKLDAAAAWATASHILELAAGDRENRRLAQFAAVGLLGVLVNLALLTGLTELAGLHYTVSAAVAIEASILSNIALNDVLTFRDRRTGTWTRRLWRFNVVSLVALVANLAVLTALTEGAGLHYLASETAAIGVAFLANYRGNLAWTYEAPEADADEPVPARVLLAEHVRRLYARAAGLVAPALGASGTDEEP